MFIQDNDREYELGWRDNVLKEFKRGLNATTDDTVTVVWDSIPFHLSNEWALETIAIIIDKYGYRPVEWTMADDTAHVTFKTFKPSAGRMGMLQKACYEK